MSQIFSVTLGWRGFKQNAFKKRVKYRLRLLLIWGNSWKPFFVVRGQERFGYAYEESCLGDQVLTRSPKVGFHRV